MLISERLGRAVISISFNVSKKDLAEFCNSKNYSIN